MKRKLLIVFSFLLFLGMMGGAQAAPIYVGSFDKALTPYPSSDLLSALTSPYIDTADNLNVLISIYNGSYDPDLPSLTDPYVEKEAPNDFPDDTTSGVINLSPGYMYLSLKYDNFVDLYYVLGETEFAFDVRKGLSHYREWNPVSEPATMILFGTCLIVVAALGRKRFLNR